MHDDEVPSPQEMPPPADFLPLEEEQVPLHDDEMPPRLQVPSSQEQMPPQEQLLPREEYDVNDDPDEVQPLDREVDEQLVPGNL